MVAPTPSDMGSTVEALLNRQ